MEDSYNWEVSICTLYCDHLWLPIDARGPQGVEGGNGTVVGTGIYDLKAYVSVLPYSSRNPSMIFFLRML